MQQPVSRVVRILKYTLAFPSLPHWTTRSTLPHPQDSVFSLFYLKIYYNASLRHS